MMVVVYQVFKYLLTLVLYQHQEIIMDLITITTVKMFLIFVRVLQVDRVNQQILHMIQMLSGHILQPRTIMLKNGLVLH